MAMNIDKFLIYPGLSDDAIEARLEMITTFPWQLSVKETTDQWWTGPVPNEWSNDWVEDWDVIADRLLPDTQTYSINNMQLQMMEDYGITAPIIPICRYTESVVDLILIFWSPCGVYQWDGVTSILYRFNKSYASSAEFIDDQKSLTPIPRSSLAVEVEVLTDRIMSFELEDEQQLLREISKDIVARRENRNEWNSTKGTG